jgi:hypothetical protein
MAVRKPRAFEVVERVRDANLSDELVHAEPGSNSFPETFGLRVFRWSAEALALLAIHEILVSIWHTQSGSSADCRARRSRAT